MDCGSTGATALLATATADGKLSYRTFALAANSITRVSCALSDLIESVDFLPYDWFDLLSSFVGIIPTNPSRAQSEIALHHSFCSSMNMNQLFPSKTLAIPDASLAQISGGDLTVSSPPTVAALMGKSDRVGHANVALTAALLPANKIGLVAYDFQSAILAIC